jgi:hypothetical protein
MQIYVTRITQNAHTQAQTKRVSTAEPSLAISTLFESELKIS